MGKGTRMHQCSKAIVAAIAFIWTQTPILAAPALPKDQQDFCALVDRIRIAATGPGAAHALPAARTEIETFIVQHRGIDWFGAAGRVVISEKNKAGSEVEACPAVWVGGVSPEGGLDSDTWAEPETHLYNVLREVTQGKSVEFRAALLGVYDARPDFPAKIWVRARIVDLSPQP
ncbi:MAG: hypothetical protein WDN69_18160 [Aliidongia sp.]